MSIIGNSTWSLAPESFLHKLISYVAQDKVTFLSLLTINKHWYEIWKQYALTINSLSTQKELENSGNLLFKNQINAFCHNVLSFSNQWLNRYFIKLFPSLIKRMASVAVKNDQVFLLEDINVTQENDWSSSYFYFYDNSLFSFLLDLSIKNGSSKTFAWLITLLHSITTIDKTFVENLLGKIVTKGQGSHYVILKNFLKSKKDNKDVERPQKRQKLSLCFENEAYEFPDYSFQKSFLFPQDFYDEKLAKVAASKGHLQILMLLHKDGFPFSRDITIDAFKCQDISIVHWLCQKGHQVMFGKLEDYVDAIVTHGCLLHVKWLENYYLEQQIINCLKCSLEKVNDLRDNVKLSYYVNTRYNI